MYGSIVRTSIASANLPLEGLHSKRKVPKKNDDCSVGPTKQSEMPRLRVYPSYFARTSTTPTPVDARRTAACPHLAVVQTVENVAPDIALVYTWVLKRLILSKYYSLRGVSGDSSSSPSCSFFSTQNHADVDRCGAPHSRETTYPPSQFRLTSLQYVQYTTAAQQRGCTTLPGSILHAGSAVGYKTPSRRTNESLNSHAMFVVQVDIVCAETRRPNSVAHMWFVLSPTATASRQIPAVIMLPS